MCGPPAGRYRQSDYVIGMRGLHAWTEYCLHLRNNIPKFDCIIMTVNMYDGMFVQLEYNSYAS